MQGTAVADVTHMLAELIENAVQYSSPGTKVQVRGGRVANGYVVEIEDRGLGIPLDIMETLNELLAKPPELDLADSDQLGLFVVSRLAARHNVKISLRVSGSGGTSAVGLLPRTLVVAEDEVPALTAKAAKEAQAAARAAASAEAASAPLVGAASGEGASPASAAAGPSGSTGPAGLPRRAPRASMAPQLRENRPTAPKGPLAGRSPEQARSLMSSIQQGLRSGRAASTTDDTDSAPGGESPGNGPGWNE